VYSHRLSACNTESVRPLVCRPCFRHQNGASECKHGSSGFLVAVTTSPTAFQSTRPQPQLQPTVDMASTSRALTAEPFRFLDLPKDIRLMVYERLPRSTKHTTIITSSSEGRITLISHSISIAILGTCQRVHQEALPLVNKAIREWVEDGGVKIISTTNHCGLSALAQLLQVLFNISEIEVCYTV